MTAAAPRIRRIDALRQLLQRDELRASMALSPQPTLLMSALAGLQAGAAMAIALPLAHLSPWPHLIGYAALGAIVALFGRFEPGRSRHRVVALCALTQTLAVLAMSLVAWAGAPDALRLGLLALSCGLFFLVSVSGRFGPPGALIFVFAAGAAMQDADSLRVVIERTQATGLAATLAWALCLASDGLRRRLAPDTLPQEPLQPLSERLRAALRIAAGAGLAIFASRALGASFPAWAGMGALTVMQGAHLRISLHRAVQRMAGTLVGTFIAFAILIQEPGLWVILPLLVLLQFATELIIGANYGLGQVLVTPMALLMTHLAAPHVPAALMAPERVIDTMLGAAIGLVAAVVMSSARARQDLARRQPA
ncbi:FUSC family protein [Marinibacterium sp. SX1]|uniref:FUSC family protein n=1 Tax=Marinibacterium sp. SX1 TaxID=3388424 RepID=UPI003D17CB76